MLLRTVVLFASVCSAVQADWRLPDERYVQGYYTVFNVAPDDVLNIRAEPRGSSPKVGSLAYNSEIVEVVSKNFANSWGKVRVGEQMGWTSMRYLRSTRVTTFGETEIPVGLRCFWEEPFVSYTFGAGVIIKNTPGQSAQSFQILEIISNNTDYKIYFKDRDTVRNMSLALDGQGTSTMADVSFLWSFNIDSSKVGTAGCTLSGD